ncbi:transcriptional regulator [Rhodococcus ruber BKS 20-38]|uniref:Transcriptional regulator n=1 Tax=Rhodococcus ruber BKS 20-38 TaxID=1278076 RepID=M3A401_9NOCA|nr:TetR/AcrR family transcriptional regulator [Rhodococcus ruber]EME67204.1 transcriptional regulator [Rhodococcus ruber BKS 20-38]
MVTSAEQGRQTRAQLMEAALGLIAERGWGAVTTRSVAERAGLRPGLVHYHFTSVTDLLVDASLEAARREVGRIVEAATAESGLGGLGRMLDAATSYDSTDPTTTTFTEMLLAATRHERLRDGLAELLRESRAVMAQWLRREKAAVVNPEASAALLMAALDGLVLHRLIDPQVRDLDVRRALRRLAGLDAHGENQGGSP